MWDRVKRMANLSIEDNSRELGVIPLQSYEHFDNEAKSMPVFE